MDKMYEKAVAVLMAGESVVMPADTIYGMFACARDKAAVERVYVVRKRAVQKPCIVVIEGAKDIAQFDISVPKDVQKILALLWNGRISATQKRKKLAHTSFGPVVQDISFHRPISIALPCHAKKWRHIHRGTGNIAFRVPAERSKRGCLLREMLARTGPLISTSANLAGEPPAETVSAARASFGSDVAVYLSAGKRLQRQPSHVVQWDEKSWKVLR